MAPEDQSWNVFGNLMLPLMFPHSAVDQGELQSCEEELTLAWERCSCCRGAARLGFWVGPCLHQMGAGVWKEEYGLERGKNSPGASWRRQRPSHSGVFVPGKRLRGENGAFAHKRKSTKRIRNGFWFPGESKGRAKGQGPDAAA